MPGDHAAICFPSRYIHLQYSLGVCLLLLLWLLFQYWFYQLICWIQQQLQLLTLHQSLRPSLHRLLLLLVLHFSRSWRRNFCILKTKQRKLQLRMNPSRLVWIQCLYQRQNRSRKKPNSVSSPSSGRQPWRVMNQNLVRLQQHQLRKLQKHQKVWKLPLPQLRYAEISNCLKYITFNFHCHKVYVGSLVCVSQLHF